MIDPDHSRWIRASVNKHFASVLATASVPFIVENDPDTLNKTKNKSRYAEIRINGPHTAFGAKDEYQYDVEVSVLCTALLSDDVYMIDKVVGIVQSAMIDFPVKKLGDGGNDDQSQWGCLVLRSDVPRAVDTVQWGQLDANNKITQSVVEGYYTLHI